MKHDRRHQAERWYLQAKHDLDTVQCLIKGKRYDSACFLSQQTAEKALKGFLTFAGEDEVWGHSVSKLATQAAAHDKNFRHCSRKCVL